MTINLPVVADSMSRYLAEIRKFLLEPNEANGPRRFDVSRFSPEAAMPLRIAVPAQK